MTSLRRLSLWAACVSAAAGAAPLPAAQAEQTITLLCEVVDPSLYLKEGQHGPELTDRTYESVDGGQTLALLDPKTGALYLLLTEESGEDPNELVYDYANQTVTITGRLYERGGLKGIVVLSVEPPQPEPDSPAPAPEPDSPAP
ncbi:MAG: hypothetical protein A3C53_06580 [Omnitrophica WOR_2 bacterium RIFCSPHIGHO2_02_FULL_68_15]|nr:MAG: hypothetical protein A3C53_06580 [Omnitrophica WOR_2 bacterium RIFCSPHIGHO2_02_FULL_68_15]